MRRGKKSGEAAIPPTPPPTWNFGATISDGMIQKYSRTAASTIPLPSQRSTARAALLGGRRGGDARDDRLDLDLVGVPLLLHVCRGQVFGLLAHTRHHRFER